MSCYYYCKYCKDYKKKQHDCRNNTSKCHANKDNLVRASTFRARNTVNQNVPANTFVKVLFQNEQFDLAN
ncbi:ABC transporter permease, partial [Bacillus toyonensis]|nr:ABC transporter permease [Bacillus toyonensis]